MRDRYCIPENSGRFLVCQKKVLQWEDKLTLRLVEIQLFEPTNAVFSGLLKSEFGTKILQS